MTAIKEALKAVGIIDANERLRDCAIEALTLSNNNWNKAKERLLNSVINDARLLWALFETKWDTTAQSYLAGIAAEMILPAKAEGGRLSDASRGTVAPLSSTHGRQLPVAPSGSGRSNGVYRHPSARSAIPLRDPASSIRNISNIVKMSLLDTFRIELTSPYGAKSIPIGDCTPAEARSWAGTKERDVRFVRMLIENLPPDEKIRKYVKADAAEAIYARVMKSDV